jgi:hypothetical protein
LKKNLKARGGCLFVDAIQQADVRAIIQGWDVGMKQLTLPPTIYTARSLPHNSQLRAAASLLGEQISAENGIDNTVHLIEETFG